MLLTLAPFLAQPSGSFINGQLNGAVYTRAGPAWYYDAAGVYQTAAQDQPLFDYSPVTGAFRGLLIEPAATNPVRFSDDCSIVDATRMNRFDCTTPSASLMVENTGTVTPTLQYIYDVTIGVTYFYSAVVQPYPGTLGKRYVGIAPARNLAGDTRIGITFDIEAGTIAAVQANAVGSVEALGDGKFRLSLHSTIPASATVPGNHFDFNFGPAPGAGRIAPYTGDGASGILISGVQCEPGQLTTRIPTGATPVTRNAPTLLLPWARAGVADGPIGIRYIFDDLSTQDTSATVSGGWSTVPTNLNRARLLGWLKL